MYAFKNRKTGNLLHIMVDTYEIQHEYSHKSNTIANITLIDPDYTNIYGCAPIWTSRTIDTANYIVNKDYKQDPITSDFFNRPLIHDTINKEDIEVIEIEIKEIFI